MPALFAYRRVVWDAVEQRLASLGIGLDDPRLHAIDFYLTTVQIPTDAVPIEGALHSGKPVYAYRTKPYLGEALLVYLTFESGFGQADIVGVFGPI